jgi:pimeloyl-ACP methyl ester carboxylesterase
VVLEAGRNDVAASWCQVMRLLAPHVHVVAYDRAGLGASAPLADPVILGRQLRDLEAVITGMAAGPCVLAGHSWGGIVVQLLAWRRPDLVAGLVLVDPPHEQITPAVSRCSGRGAERHQGLPAAVPGALDWFAARAGRLRCQGRHVVIDGVATASIRTGQMP